MSSLGKIFVGTVVQRGPHWIWGTQDFLDGKPDTGIVLGVEPRPSEFNVKVKWKNGHINRYRYSEKHLDIRVVKTTKTFNDLL